MSEATGTAVAVPQQRGDLAAKPATANDLMTWAYAARQAHEIAVSLAETSFVPKAMYRKPGEVTGAILAGRELGLDPMSSLRSIDIIDGTPAMRAHALRGLVQHHGHEVWVDESTDHRAIVCGRRKGSQHVERSTWTIDRAKKAGLAGKKNWQAHPAAMLIARATGEVCRLVAADVLLGMPYSAEEIGDGLDPDASTPVEDLAPKAATRRRIVQRAPIIDQPLPEADVDFDAAPKVDEPAADEEATAVAALSEAGFDVEVIDEGEVVEREPMMTDAQRRRLAVACRDAQISDRDERLAFASKVVGRPLETSNELTVSEARRVIDALVVEAGKLARPPGEEWP